VIGAGERARPAIVLAVYPVQGAILALMHPDCQKIKPDGVNGQHTQAEHEEAIGRFPV
jgi:hypothetical protein